MSEVRNKLVHNVSNVGITLEDYVCSLGPEDKKGFETAFKWGYKDTANIPITIEDKYDAHEVIKLIAVTLMEQSQYKLAIWLGSIIVLWKIYAKSSQATLEKQKREIDEKSVLQIMSFRPKEDDV